MDDLAARLRRSEELKHAASDAWDRASALRAALHARRGGASFRDQMEVWEETRRTLREMERAARELAAEREDSTREVAEQTAWVRAQVESLLDAGWTREELAGIGIGNELLELVGLRGDPRLEEPEAGSGDGRRGREST
jgi:hypothetical protein